MFAEPTLCRRVTLWQSQTTTKAFACPWGNEAWPSTVFVPVLYRRRYFFLFHSHTHTHTDTQIVHVGLALSHGLRLGTSGLDPKEATKEPREVTFYMWSVHASSHLHRSLHVFSQESTAEQRSFQDRTLRRCSRTAWTPGLQSMEHAVRSISAIETHFCHFQRRAMEPRVSHSNLLPFRKCSCRD